MLRLDKPPDRWAFQRHVPCPLVPSPGTGSPDGPRWTQLVTDLITCLLLPLPLSPLSCSSLCSAACWLAGCWLQGLGNRLTCLLQGPPGDHPAWLLCSRLFYRMKDTWKVQGVTRGNMFHLLLPDLLWAKEPKLYLGKESLGWS